MANAIDEDTGEFVELYNPTDAPVDVAGLVLSDSLATDVIGPFPGLTDTIIPARGFGLILDPEYASEYSIPEGTVLLAPDDTTLGNGLATTDSITILASDGLTIVSTFSFPINPGNGISVEKRGDTGDVESNWVASTCASGSSPGAVNCTSEAEPVADVADVVISEVMANPEDEARGEFVEIVNRGDASVILEDYVLSDGDATDLIQSFDEETTELLPGGIAIVLDQSYGELDPVPYAIPPGTVLLTTNDRTLGSGLSTDDPITLLAPDGSTVISTYGFPFNPGNGISAERIDLDSPDSPDNWLVSPCPSGSSPGSNNCAGAADPCTVADVNTASESELTAVTGIGPSTASAIIAYRDAHGPFESLSQLCVIDAITQDKINDWMVADEDEAENVIGLADARDVVVFPGVADLLAALPDPTTPGAWDGTPVRVQRAAVLDESDWAEKQAFTFADWGDETLFEPTEGATLSVFLDRPSGAASYTREQTSHANAMSDWDKTDGDPYLNPDFYRWSSPLSSFGRISYAHVFALEGVVEVHDGSWRLRVRSDSEPGIDRVVLIERWLAPEDWGQLQTVWTYGYKSVVVLSTSGYTYSLPYRLVLAHPARAFWFDEHGEWLSILRCVSFGECYDAAETWGLFNVALTEWKEAPVVGDGYCFDHDSVDYCFTTEEDVLGLQILNEASYSDLTDHCYTSYLANVVLSNRPFDSIAGYDATSGVGSKSLWNLLVCYVRSGDWPPATEGTVQAVLQDIPDNEYETVTVGTADVVSISGRLLEICDPSSSEQCIHVYSYRTLPETLTVGDSVTVHGEVRYYATGEIWEIVVSEDTEYVTILEEG